MPNTPRPSHQPVQTRTLDELRTKFAVPGVTLAAGEGGLPCAIVETPAAKAIVYLHGAHITHFQPAGQAPLLFVSGKSHFASGKAIRGGVPIIFPWFGAKADDAAAPAHGLVRSTPWELHDVTATGGAVRLTFALDGSPETWPQWPHDAELRYAVTVGSSLEMELTVSNPAAAAGPFTFEEALHTYLAVGDIRNVKIDGLSGREFLDKTDGMKHKRQPTGAFALDAETDRVYVGTTDTVTFVDPTGGPGQTPLGSRTVTVAKSNSNCTVVWNPWIAKAKAMSDFGDDEWPAMLCIETANVAEYAITLSPGQSHVMRASVSAI